MNRLVEERILKSSIVVLIIFASAGIVFGLFLDSEVILFEGIYNVLSIIIGFLTLHITRYIAKSDKDRFPFGKEGIIPCVVFVQFLILNITLVSMFIDAVFTIVQGGSSTDLGFAMGYLMVSSFCVTLFCRYLKKVGKSAASSIVDSELKQWDVARKQGYFVLIGYAIGFVISRTAHSGLAAYVDPVVLIVFTVFTIMQTVNAMITAFKEMVGMSTISDAVYQRLDNTIDRISDNYGIKDYFLRVKSLGGMLVLEVDFLIDHLSECQSVQEHDRVRDEIYQFIHEKNLNLWLNITFTTEMRWIE